MKSTVETLSPTRVRLNVEVPFDELKPSLDKAYRTIANQIVVPGFRKGRVPPRLIDQRVGRAAVLEETLNEAIPTSYSQAVQEHEVKVLGRPEVEVTELADGEKVTFTAEVEVRPALELPAFSGLTVRVDDATVTEADVDAQLDRLRERFGVLKGVDRPVQAGDYVSLDLVATVDGEPVPGGTADGISYQVGSGQLLEGTDDAVVGLSAGENATFTTRLVGGEYAGRDAEVSVVVKSVKEKQLPELDDTFAQTASEFDTLDELRADLRTQLERARRVEQAVQARDRALDALLDAVDVPMPEKLLAEEIEFRRHRIQHAMETSGVTMEQYLSNEGQTQEEFDAAFEADAARAVRAQLVLDTVADSEQLGLDDAELTREVVRRAQQAGMSPQQYADELVKAGQLPALATELRRGKALSLVLQYVTVTDESGQPVDVDAVRRELAVSADG